MSRGLIRIIQGAFWGSEAKGMVAGAMALREGYSYAVRTGAINAGHTVYYNGRPYAMQQLPVAWVNPDTKLVIGPGAYVHVGTLMSEIGTLEAIGVNISGRLIVDERVAWHADAYSNEAKTADRHAKIGATGKGCAEAIIHKIKDRGVQQLLLKDVVDSEGVPWQWEKDTPGMLLRSYDRGECIMLEGTQGELLDFHLGPWPYVTSRQTTAAAWMAEAGLPPTLDVATTLVARTYPIRVAGNSGPMPGEISWPMLARTIRQRLDYLQMGQDHPLYVRESTCQDYENAVTDVGYKAGVCDLLYCHTWGAERRLLYKSLLSNYTQDAVSRLGVAQQEEIFKLFEKTTVTKKIRRIARMNPAHLAEIIYRTRPNEVVLTFLNYEFPEVHGKVVLSDDAAKMALNLSQSITHVTTGPKPEHLLRIR